MIVTMLPKSANFHAVLYNERKVAEGVATLLVKDNISGAAAFNDYTPEEMRQFFVDYSLRNSRIKFPQFHVAISCKGHEYSEEQLVELAHRWLAKMGYADQGQPLLIYGHHDTDNTHIHIITSRVNPQGKKIDHNHEWRRSQSILDSLMGIDAKKEVEDDIETARGYTFNDIGGFQSIMQSLGYECYFKAATGKVYDKKGGAIKKALDRSEVESWFRKHTHPVNDDDRTKELNHRRRQLYGIFKRYMCSCSSLKEFADSMKKGFGIDLVFYGSKDAPTGYRVVDHSQKAVHYAVVDISKLTFQTVEERLNRAKETISRLLAENPEATTREVNKTLMREWHAYIKEGSIVIEHTKYALDDAVTAVLKNNNREAYRRENPTARSEQPSLSSFSKSRTSFNKSTPSTTHEPSSHIRSSHAQGAPTVSRDHEVSTGINSDDLDEQMKQRLKL